MPGHRAARSCPTSAAPGARWTSRGAVLRVAPGLGSRRGLVVRPGETFRRAQAPLGTHVVQAAAMSATPIANASHETSSAEPGVAAEAAVVRGISRTCARMRRVRRQIAPSVVVASPLAVAAELERRRCGLLGAERRPGRYSSESIGHRDQDGPPVDERELLSKELGVVLGLTPQLGHRAEVCR